MRLVIALGGNALLKRGEPLSAENQRANMKHAAAAIAALCDGNEVIIVHGNGPQVGLLALQAAAYESGPPMPLDLLGAETQGMIGYVIAQELRNVRPKRSFVSLLTQTLVDPEDEAFATPSKPIGPIYTNAEAAALAEARSWSFGDDGKGRRRVVASPSPIEIIEQDVIEHLAGAGVVVICGGGGGAPVRRTRTGGLEGVEAVIDKDLVAALLGVSVGADKLIILTDVDAVYADWGRPRPEPLSDCRASALDPAMFAAGSMGPKVRAARDFVIRTGKSAAIGALADATEVFAGRKGTQIHRG